MRSLETGNDTREGHLQNARGLSAEKHPDLVFERVGETADASVDARGSTRFKL